MFVSYDLILSSPKETSLPSSACVKIAGQRRESACISDENGPYRMSFVANGRTSTFRKALTPTVYLANSDGVGIRSSEARRNPISFEIQQFTGEHDGSA